MSYSSEVLADSPLGYWRHGESSGATTLVDSSGNGRDGTYTGTVTRGSTGLLTGDTDLCATYGGGYADVPYASWMLASSFTIEAIIRPTSVSGSGYQFIASRDSSGTAGPWWFVIHNGKLEFAFWLSDGSLVKELAGTTTLVGGTTYHVAATYDGTNMRVYLNGALEATFSKPGTPRSSSSPSLRIGNWPASNLPFGGKIDEVAFYGTALSGTRIAAHNTAITAAASSTVTLSANRPARTAAFTVGTVASATLSATRPARTASFSATTVAAATLSATRPSRTASFTAATVVAAALTAVTPLRAAAFTVEVVAETRSIALTAERPQRTGQFDVLAGALVALAADRPTRTGTFALAGVGDLALAATRPSRTAAFTLDAGIARPANDDFANAEIITLAANGDTYTSAEISNAEATTEPDEDTRGESSSRSLWWSYTPATSGTVTFDTVGSYDPGNPTGPADTQITVWTGDSVDALTRVVDDSDDGGDHGGNEFTSWVQFAAVGGTTYRLQVGAWDAQVVTVVVNVTGPATPAPPPAADVGLAGVRLPREATFVARATIPITPVPAHLVQHGPAPVVVARALGPVTAWVGPHGTQPRYSVSKAAIQRARQQIVVDGVDITFLRGVRTPDVTYTLLAPLRYGPGQLDLPQVVGGMESLGSGRATDLAWMWEGAPVTVNLVLDDPNGIDLPTMLAEDIYKGVLVAWDLDGRNVSIELGGEANGRAAMRDRQAVIFPRVNDIGHQISDAVKDLGLPVYPPLGHDTGIEVMTTGGTGHLEHIQSLCAQAWTRQGKYWTIMPNAAGAYEVRQKSDTVRRATVFFDDARTVAKLRRDLTAEPNRIFVTGVTPQGKRVRFGVYPGLVQGDAPEFPGHMESGDPTTEGVRLLIRKLQQTGYLKLEDVVGGYDFDVVEAVKDLQDDAGLPKTGEVNEATWNALYDIGVTGLSLVGAHIEPAAQDARVRRVNRSANGTVLEFNDDYDPSVLPRDRTVDAGVGKTRSQLREFARTLLEAASSPNWVGDITFHTGALLKGEQSADVVPTPEMVLDARLLVPTENLWAPRFEGGTQFNVSAVQVGADGTVTATVDTRFRDALEVWEIIDRNKESRNDPARRRNQAARSSTISKDSLGEWDEIGGLLGVDLHLVRGWNIWQMPGVAAEGQIRRLKVVLNDPAECAVAVFGRKPDKSWLTAHIPAPLTITGTKAWDKYDEELVSDYWMLFSAGTHDNPGGYSPGRKIYKSVTGREPNPDYDPDTDPESEEYVEVTTTEVSGTLTGRLVDAAGFPYFSDDRTSVWMAVWVNKPNVIEAGRLLWPQLEAGA